MNPSNSWFSTTRTWSIDLTRFFSQTDTAGERDFGPFLRERLAKLPYFQAHPEHLRLAKTVSDAHERSVVFALVQGSGPQTTILTGHYDVVEIENYGSLAPWACDPEALLPRLVALLESEAAEGPGLSPNDQLALDDLRSGDFLPGRGLLDMKSGLAAGIAVLQRYSQLPLAERPGSLLFIAVPDEEVASNGVRSAGALLPRLAQEWNLRFDLAINLDSSNDHGDGSQGQAVYVGSVGKLLPAVYLVGRETHAGSPFNGINANLLASELTRRIECNVALCDRLDGMATVPPTCLKQADTKPHYDVTTPTTAWAYYNWLVLQQPVAAVLETVKTLAGEALEAAMAAMKISAGQYAHLANQDLILPDWQPQVYTYAQVKGLALQRGGAAFEAQLETLEAQLGADPGLDTPTCCLRLTEAVWAASGLAGPAAVVGIAAIYYPPVALAQAGEKAVSLGQTLSRLAAGMETPITQQPFFPGISDMSFLGGQVSAAETETLAANLPAWQSRARFDYSSVSRLNMPVVNIGPWGRDYHQRGERLYMPYAFQTLPEFLWRIVREVLE